MAESVTITVAGVDRTDDLCQPGVSQTLEWAEALRERKTISFSLVRRSGSWKSERGQHVTLAHSAEGAIFGGYLTEVTRRKVSGSTAVFFDCAAVAYEQICDRRRAAAYTYIDTAGEDIFTQICDDSLIGEGFTVVIDDPGSPVIPKFEIQSPRPTVREALDSLTELMSTGGDVWYWRIDPDKTIHLFKQDTTPAPFSITDATPYVLGTSGEYATVHETSDGKINRVFVYAGQYLRPLDTESFVGDGATRTFELTYPCGAKPSIKVNGVEVGDFIGVDGQTGYQWYWSQNSKTIRQDDGGTLLTGSDDLDVTYQGLDRLEAGPVEDAADASAEGVLQGDGTGIYEAMLTIETPQTLGDAETLAAAHLARYTQATVTFRGATFTSGLRAGQELAVNLTDLDINLSMLVKSVSMTDRGGGRFLWSFTAIYGAARDDWKRALLGKTGSGVIAGGGPSGGGATPTTPLQITFAGAQGQQGVPFTASLVATGGSQPYTFSIASGSLPSGVTLDTATGKISGTPAASGSFAITGRVTDTTSATADVSVTIVIALPSGTVEVATWAFSATPVDNTGARWSNPALHAVITVQYTLSATPRVVTFWAGKHGGTRFWRGQRVITAGSGTVQLGAQGTTEEIYPPTVASETWEVVAAVGAYGPADAIPVSAVTSATFTLSSPGTYASTGSSTASSATQVDVVGIGGGKGVMIQFDFGLPLADPKFFFARLTREIGKYVTGVWTPLPSQPTFEGVDGTPVGDWAGPTLFYSAADHAPIFSLTGDIQTSGLTTVRASIGPWNHTSDSFNILKFRLYIATREDDGSGGTKTKQATWPAGADSHDVTLDSTKSNITKVNIATAQGTAQIDSTTNGYIITGGGGTGAVLYPGFLTVTGAAATLEVNDSYVGLFAQKFKVGATGEVVAVNNVLATGYGLTPITAQYKSTGRTTAYSQAITDQGGATPSGLYEVDVALVVNYPGGSPAGSLTLQVWFAKGSIGAAALTLNLSAGGFFATGKAICLTDGTTDSFVPVTGLAITSTVGTAWANATFDVYVSVRKLRGL